MSECICCEVARKRTYKCFRWAWICKVRILWHALSFLISNVLLLRKYNVWNIAARFMDAIWTHMPIFLNYVYKIEFLISVFYIRLWISAVVGYCSVVSVPTTSRAKGGYFGVLVTVLGVSVLPVNCA